MTLPPFAPSDIYRGACYLVDMNPPRRSKPGKVRPVVVIQSDDVLKADSPSVVVVPMSTQLRSANILRVRVFPSKGLRLSQESDLLLDQVHTIDRSLFLEYLGDLPVETFERVEHGVKFLLDF